MRRPVLTVAVAILAAALDLPAQLTPDQRAADFQALAAVYARRYAPFDWKRTLHGANLFDLSAWLPRVRAARDDAEFYEISAEYVASFDDLHTYLLAPGRMVADLGFTVDLYDGVLLVDSINRRALPAGDYPFQVGDELVSVDGRTGEQWITEFSRLRRRGNLRTTRRGAADLITFRPQSWVPRAAELGDTADVVIRRQSGEEQAYTIRWTKTGYPFRTVSPVPKPQATGRAALDGSLSPSEQVRQLTRDIWDWSAPAFEPLRMGETYASPDGPALDRKWVLGYGARTPAFAPFPGFRVRRGLGAADYLFTATYESGGKRIGYIRLPGFAPLNSLGAVAEIDTEIAYMEQNTDGLVVDVMRNSGGGCYMLDVARRLIPTRGFYFFGEELRVTLDRLNNMQSLVELAERFNAEPWVQATYRFYRDLLQQGYEGGLGLTGAIPVCTALDPLAGLRAPTFENDPASVVYTKPLIVLIDEFSTSAGDIFPAMLQDNRRGPLVGVRTNGAGGSISAWPSGAFSESVATNTNSLVVRREFRTVAGYPNSRYVENVGAHPDIPLEFMTRENLMNGGRPFVEAFTRILLDEISRTTP